MNITDVYDRLTAINNYVIGCLESGTPSRQVALEDVHAKLVILQSDMIRAGGVKR